MPHEKMIRAIELFGTEGAPAVRKKIEPLSTSSARGPDAGSPPHAGQLHWRHESALTMQQSCSNPSKSPELLGKASKQKYNCLQVFCKTRNDLAKHHAAFARRRAGVRLPSGPLLK